MEIFVRKYRIEPEMVFCGTEGSYGIETMEFVFSREWEHLAKTVTFYPPRRAPVAVVISDNFINIPWEVTDQTAQVKFVIEGYADGVNLRTVPSTLSVVSTKKAQGVTGTTPTQTEYQQIYDLMEDTLEAVENVGIKTVEVNALPEEGEADTIYCIDNGGESPERFTKYIWFNGTWEVFGTVGLTGNGIIGINKTSTSGLVDTYTVAFTDGTSTTFEVTNGAEGPAGQTGPAGNGIVSVTKMSTSGLVDTYRISFTNGSYTTFNVTNGAKGDKGDSGLPEADPDTDNMKMLKWLVGGSTPDSASGDVQGPTWTRAICAQERKQSGNIGTASIITGNTTDSASDGGYVGTYFMRGNHNGVSTLIHLSPHYGQSGTRSQATSYRFTPNTPEDIAYVISSDATDHTSGNIAVFNGAASVTEGIPVSSIEQNTNKVTSISSASTDAQYPTAKCVYDAVDRVSSSIPTKTSDLTNDGSDGNAAYLETDETAHNAAGILYGKVNSTSTSTAFTATVSGVTAYYDGLTVMLKNGVVTSASGFTINVNGLGAKPVYSNMAAATAETTIFNVDYTMMFVYDSTRVTGGGWICYRGYNSDTNTIGYQLRTNSTILKASDRSRYYKIFFTSADGTHWVPASSDWTNNATSARAVNQRPIDPFGRIAYTSSSTNFTAESAVTATTMWSRYNLTLGYSFNRTGEALTLTNYAPVYVKCAPQSNGSAIIDATTPYVQALPSTDDGKIYIFLGIATSATQVELYDCHPVYYYAGGRIRLWTGARDPQGANVFTGNNTIDEVYASFITGVPTYIFRDNTMYLVNSCGYMTGIYADRLQISALGSLAGGVSGIDLKAVLDKEIATGTLVSTLYTVQKFLS